METTIDKLLIRMNRVLGSDFRAALFTDGGGKGPYVMIMRAPDEKYPSVWSQSYGSTLHEAFAVAIEMALWKIHSKIEVENNA